MEIPSLALRVGLAFVSCLAAVESSPAQCAQSFVKQVPSPIQGGEELGVSISSWGEWTAAGSAPTHIGKVYLYRKSPRRFDWTLFKEIEPPGVSSGDNDMVVALRDELLVVGAPSVSGSTGEAYVYEQHAGGPDNWGHVQTIASPNGNYLARFGDSIATGRDVVLISAPHFTLAPPLVESYVSQAGIVYVYERNMGQWTLSDQFFAPDPVDRGLFGTLALDGDSLVVGAPGYHVGDYLGAGTAYLYERENAGSNDWELVQQVLPDTASKHPVFAVSVALSGNSLLIGAIGDDDQGQDAGAVYVFERGDDWQLIQKIYSSTPWHDDRFGHSLALSGELATVAGDIATDGRHVLVRDAQSEPWKEIAVYTVAGGLLGGPSALNGHTLIAGAPFDQTKAWGAVYFLDLASPLTSTNYCSAGTSKTGCTASLCGLGLPSATAANGFQLQAYDVEASKAGIFFYGANGPLLSPWGQSGSFLCVAPPRYRTTQMPGVGVKGTCQGFFSLDLNAWWHTNPSKAPGAGAVVQAQLWYRDNLNITTFSKSSLSDAIEFAVSP